LRVEWYAANPGFHEIPPGYGLPWGTPDEEFIPAPLVFESEFALAKAQLATQTPACGTQPNDLPLQPATPAAQSEQSGSGQDMPKNGQQPSSGANKKKAAGKAADAIKALYEQQEADEELPKGDSTADTMPALQSASPTSAATTAANGQAETLEGFNGSLPPDWPDERGFIPPPPSPVRPACCPNNGPVMTHTRIYHGTDSEFTEALASYYHFRDDARFGGWQNYLQRSDDFIRFCCHMHIAEMLSARGGAGETRVVWQWSDCR
jgi:hypothetical protein